MYVPEHFAMNDPARLRAVIDDYDFALLVTAAEGQLEASHLPFVYEPEGGPQGIDRWFAKPLSPSSLVVELNREVTAEFN